MASTSMTARVAAVLPFTGIVLALADWNASPGAARAWAVAIALFVVMLAIRYGLPFAVRRSTDAAVTAALVQALAGVNIPIIFAALMIIVSLSIALARAHGIVIDARMPQIAIDRGLATRAVMILCGAYLAVMGNRVPRMLPPVASNRWLGARAQAFHRFVGWTWVLCGLGWVAAWLVLPIPGARTVSISLAGAAMVATAVQLVRLARNTMPHARA